MGAQKLKKDPGLTKRQFMAKFESKEQDAIAAAAVNNSALWLWAHKLSLADAVHLDHPDMVAGMAGMVAAGLITETRKSEILTP